MFKHESSDVMFAYSTGTEMGHCSYIRYLEESLQKARKANCLVETNAKLKVDEIAKLIRYNSHSTIGVLGAMRPAEKGVYVKYDDVVEAIRISKEIIISEVK